jgi:Flp pilus assembly pilin Flp
MRTRHPRIPPWLAGEEGQDLIEYTLLTALLALAMVLLLPRIASSIMTVFSRLMSALP